MLAEPGQWKGAYNRGRSGCRCGTVLTQCAAAPGPLRVPQKFVVYFLKFFLHFPDDWNTMKDEKL